MLETCRRRILGTLWLVALCEIPTRATQQQKETFSLKPIPISNVVTIRRHFLMYSSRMFKTYKWEAVWKSENSCSGNVVWGSWGAPGVEVGKEGRRLGTRCTWIINFYDSVRFKSYSFCFSMFYSLRRISCFSLLMAFWQLPTAKFKGRPGLSHLQGHALLLPLPTQCTSLYRTISQQQMYTLLYSSRTKS